jgi:hypothetical protein
VDGFPPGIAIDDSAGQGAGRRSEECARDHPRRTGDRSQGSSSSRSEEPALYLVSDSGRTDLRAHRFGLGHTPT